MTQKPASLFDWKIVGPALGDSFKKLHPQLMIGNPVMFVTLVGAILTTVGIPTSPGERVFVAHLSVWLWFTVLFANFAEAVAEGRGKAQAATLRKARKETAARPPLPQAAPAWAWPSSKVSSELKGEESRPGINPRAVPPSRSLCRSPGRHLCLSRQTHERIHSPKTQCAGH